MKPMKSLICKTPIQVLIAIAALTNFVTVNSMAETTASYSEEYTIAGTKIPAAVQELLAKAKAAGAESYDIGERNKDGDLIYNHYSATSEAEGNMEFSYTEITPEKLQADLQFKGDSLWMSGQANGVVEYETKSGGTGNVMAVYDEASHTAPYMARGPQGQIWANNCGILEDGSIHCLPAERRNDTSGYIMTNPDLSRGQKMMYNGHIDIESGVVVSVEVSGVISKRVASGKIKMINPLALLKAWGFKLAPGLTVYFSNTSKGEPVEDKVNGIFVEAKN